MHHPIQCVNVLCSDWKKYLIRYKKDGQTMKGQYKYVKLHTNRKTIYVGHTSEKNMPSIEDLEPKIQVLIICLIMKSFKVEQISINLPS